ncbi:MAG: hypothetical protein GOV15_04705 [Candidatus Diapherotrites archaeon]|nr:hypothetical protein [Candidatus Diapherotrites archaeon]
MVTGKVSDTIILDTNMMLVPVQFGVDIYSEVRKLFPGLRIVTLDICLKELEKIGGQSTKKGLMVKFSTELMNKNGVKVLSESGYADDVLVSMGKKGAIIATNDRDLKKRLKKEDVKIIYLRKKKFLETE